MKEHKRLRKIDVSCKSLFTGQEESDEIKPRSALSDVSGRKHLVVLAMVKAVSPSRLLSFNRPDGWQGRSGWVVGL